MREVAEIMSTAWATVLAALLSAGAAIIVSVLNSRAQHRQLLAELQKHSELQAYRIEELEKKVEKHNQVVERTYALERRADVTEEKLRVANHRIDDLERGGAG